MATGISKNCCVASEIISCGVRCLAYDHDVRREPPTATGLRVYIRVVHCHPRFFIVRFGKHSTVRRAALLIRQRTKVSQENTLRLDIDLDLKIRIRSLVASRPPEEPSTLIRISVNLLREQTVDNESSMQDCIHIETQRINGPQTQVLPRSACAFT